MQTTEINSKFPLTRVTAISILSAAARRASIRKDLETTYVDVVAQSHEDLVQGVDEVTLRRRLSGQDMVVDTVSWSIWLNGGLTWADVTSQVLPVIENVSGNYDSLHMVAAISELNAMIPSETVWDNPDL